MTGTSSSPKRRASAGSCQVADDETVRVQEALERLAPPQPTPVPVEHGELGWALYEAPGLPTHRVPTWDIRGHMLCVHSCPCKPTYDDIHEHYVHHAFDGREAVLTLARRIH
jgi:hypothetical protein